MVAVIGYSVSFHKTSLRLLRGESNLFFSLAQWKDNKLSIAVPPNMHINFTALVLIYDENGHTLWHQRYVPALESRLHEDWLTKRGYFELDTDTRTSSAVVGDNPSAQIRLKELDSSDDNALTHSVAVNRYQATGCLPPLTIVVVDTIPHQLQRTDLVLEWFSYILLANLLFVVPLLWLTGHLSLRPIKDLIRQVRELEVGERERLDENLPRELDILVRNLNILLNNERQRYQKYRSTLSDLTRSLKTPLAVLQTTLRSLRTDRDTNINIEMAEPVMLQQISRISQQIGYYLHRATVHSDHNVLSRELHSVPSLLDSLCSSLNKVYQRKGVSLSIDVSPELTFIGEKNDFMEVTGNILANACKYCLEFVEVSAREWKSTLLIIIEDDGPGIHEAKRTLIFQRGQRADTLLPGQGLGLSVAGEILEQYAGNITISESPLGGALVEVIFNQQGPAARRRLRPVMGAPSHLAHLGKISDLCRHYPL